MPDTLLEKVQRKLARLEEATSLPTPLRGEDVPLVGATLRGYQVEGLNWLRERRERGHGAILGDEMGLGKTLQTVSFLLDAHLLRGDERPSLVLAPLSVLDHWRDELASRAPSLRLCAYVGDKETREELKTSILRDLHAGGRGLTPFQVMLSTPDILRRDASFLAG